MILLFLVAPSATSLAGGYLWPIEGHNLLSSVFGDYRDLHFHMGIDIRTGGKIGAKIVAPANGRIFRLFTSYRGYGKAAYLETEDGKIFVFGHLSSFSPKVSDVVEKEQLKNKRYYVDLFPGGIEVKKGELVGYSGESGSGGPHLHFETRDQENRPINPLTCGFGILDSIPPVLKEVAFGPGDPGSKINGQHRWMSLPFHYEEDQKAYVLKDTVRVDGKLKLALLVSDKMNKSRHEFGIYQTKLLLDGELLFFSSYDSLDFEKTHKIDLVRDFFWKKNKSEELYKLFLEKGDDLGIYPKKNGLIDAKSEDDPGKNRKGYHQIEISACDANGNCAKALFVLLFDVGPAIGQILCEEIDNHTKVKVEVPAAGEVKNVHLETTKLDSISWVSSVSSEKDWGGEYSFTVSREPQIVRITAQDRFGTYSNWKYLMLNHNRIPEPPDYHTPSSVRCAYSFDEDSFIFYIFFEGFILKEPQVCLEAFGMDLGSAILERLDDTTFYAVVPFDTASQGTAELIVQGENILGKEFQFDFPIAIAITTPSGGGEAKSWDGKARMQVLKQGVYENINLVILKTDDINKDMLKETFYSLEPRDTPLNKAAKIWLRYPDYIKNPDRIAVYGYNNKGGIWEFAGRELNKNDGMVGGSVKYFSTYALGQDTTPPAIGRVRPKANQKFGNRRPKISAKIEDDLSGIEDDRDISVYLDGEWLIPEYDIDSGILKSKPHFDLSIGRHTLTITAKDRMGNSHSIKREFEVISR